MRQEHGAPVQPRYARCSERHAISRHCDGPGRAASQHSSGGTRCQDGGFETLALASGRVPSVTYRPLCPSDVPQLRELHAALFPLNYEAGFFEKAVRGHDNIFSWCGVQRDGEGREQIVGVITARLALLAEADALDRKLMHLASAALDTNKIVYLLTIGVVPGLQNQGIASDLLRLVEHRAAELSCRAIYLHVLAVYNAPAVAFYHRHGFWEASLLKDFYNISTGRQPEPKRTEYDALLFVRYVADVPPSPATAVVSAAISQLRAFSACLPFWAPRRSNGLFLGNASRCVALPRPPNGNSAAFNGSGAAAAAGLVASGPQWLQRMFRGRT